MNKFRVGAGVLCLLIGLVTPVFGQEWIAVTVTDSASRGFQAGNEADGAPVFIIRASFQGGTTVGKFIPKAKAAYVPWGGLENPVRDFELFIGHGLWKPMNLNAPLPEGAIVGGNESDGSVLYIIRSLTGKALVPGKYSAKTRLAYIPWDGKEVEVSQFEILVRNPVLAAPSPSADPPAFSALAEEWIPADVTNNASRAQAAGRSPDGTPSFLIRAPFQGGVTPGKFNPKAKSAYVPWGGLENPVKTFELYVGRGAWVAADPRNPIPANAVAAGSEADGTPLLAIRAPSGQALVPGKFSTKTREAFISIGGKEVKVGQYEFLVRILPPRENPALEELYDEPVQAKLSPEATMLDELRRAVLSSSALQAKALTVRGGSLSAAGELGPGDFKARGRSVDAYRLSLDPGAEFNLALSAQTARSEDLQVYFLDALGNESGTVASFGNIIQVFNNARSPGPFFLLIVQNSPGGQGPYGFSLQETAFVIEGGLQGGIGFDQESLVPIAWDPRIPFWDVEVRADFSVEFEVLDINGRAMALSTPGGNNEPTVARASFTPRSRGLGSIRITPRFPAEKPFWRLSVRMNSGS